jgi:hypothetical protein
VESITDITEITDLDGKVSPIVAKAFFEQLREWKKNGVPRTKLEASSSREVLFLLVVGVKFLPCQPILLGFCKWFHFCYYFIRHRIR